MAKVVIVASPPIIIILIVPVLKFFWVIDGCGGYFDVSIWLGEGCLLSS